MVVKNLFSNKLVHFTNYLLSIMDILFHLMLCKLIVINSLQHSKTVRSIEEKVKAIDFCFSKSFSPFTLCFDQSIICLQRAEKSSIAMMLRKTDRSNILLSHC